MITLKDYLIEKCAEAEKMYENPRCKLGQCFSSKDEYVAFYVEASLEEWKQGRGITGIEKKVKA